MVLTDAAHRAAISHLSEGSRRVKLLWVGGELGPGKGLNLFGGQALDSICVLFYHIIIDGLIIFHIRTKSSQSFLI